MTTTQSTDKVTRNLTDAEKVELGLGYRSDAVLLLSPDDDATMDVKAEVVATIAGEMRLRIREGKVVGLILYPYEGSAGYFGPRTDPDGTPERDGGDIPNAAYDLAVECIASGFMFPNDWEFPSWCEWVC